MAGPAFPLGAITKYYEPCAPPVHAFGEHLTTLAAVATVEGPRAATRGSGSHLRENVRDAA